ncbi:MAG TPA: SRPBCC domain-containing protein [Micromonosporaceae bacterium]
MRLEHNFEVPVPVGQAWQVLLDVPRIAPCMPGAALTSFDGTGFTGTVKVKLGPVNLTYRGNGRFLERDEVGRRVSFVASGQDIRGAGGASARVTAVLHDARAGAATLVKVVTDLDISGRAAQMGRGMIGDVSGKLIQQFADCLSRTITEAGAAGAVPSAEPAPPAEPVLPSAPAPSAEPEPEPVPSAEAKPPQTQAVPMPAVSEVSAPAAESSGAAAGAPAPAEAPTRPAEAPVPAAEAPAVEAAGPGAVPPQAPPSGVPEPGPQQARTPHPPAEVEPIDLLELSGAKGLIRRAAPVLIAVAIILVVVIVWLIVS